MIIEWAAWAKAVKESNRRQLKLLHIELHIRKSIDVIHQNAMRFFVRWTRRVCIVLLQSRTFNFRLPLICIQFLGCWSATIAKHVPFLYVFFLGERGQINDWTAKETRLAEWKRERIRSAFDDMLARTLMSLLQTDMLYSHMLTNFIRIVLFVSLRFCRANEQIECDCVCVHVLPVVGSLFDSFFFGCFNVEFSQNSKNH